MFWKTKIFSEKLEYRFLHESTKIENATFSYKNALSEATIKKGEYKMDLSQKTEFCQ